MNFLAHAYLSFRNPDILVGNMISDFVKGKKKFDYPESVQKGITLHRSIDEFTDHHPAVKEAASYFRNDYRLYAAAFTDIVFDYFLAHDPSAFPGSGDLADFADHTYRTLDKFEHLLPYPFSSMFPHMKDKNWLLNYQHTWGIHNSFRGLVSRAEYMNNAEPAFNTFLENNEALASCYREFFPSLREFATQQYEALLRND